MYDVPLCDRSVLNSINSDYSNHITNVKNAYLSFNGTDSEDVSFGFRFSGIGDCIDFYETKDSRLCYETFSVVDSERMFWSSNCANCYNVWFSDNCRNCTDCFGCVGLKKAQYCILNKQYSREEYFYLRSKIVDHMNTLPYVSSDGLIYKYGEFFPPEFSPLSHEQSSAWDYFLANNYQSIPNSYNVEIPSSSLPEKVSEIDDSIVDKVIECKDKQKCIHRCVGAFKITQTELQFYKRFNIPLPRTCSNCRFYTRMEKLNSPILRDEVCMCEKTTHQHKNKCLVEFKTNYPLNNPQILYCEDCYKQELY